MQHKRLQGQVAWISGAASGMGQAAAELFAREGAKVIMADIQKNRAAAIVDAITTDGGQVLFHECDVGREDEVQSSITRAVEHFGGLQIIVNCAGIVHVGPLHRCTEADWDEIMGVNLKSIFFAVKHGIPHLRQNRRSYVVNVGSVSGFVGQANTPAYIASKHAVLGLTRAIALDYAVDGVRCNCVAPGITDTPMLRYHMRSESDPTGDAALADRLRRVPTGVALTPDNIAKTILYLSGEDSAGVTGASLVIDGGYTAAAEWETSGITRFM